jgi:hypothetical protein
VLSTSLTHTTRLPAAYALPAENVSASSQQHVPVSCLCPAGIRSAAPACAGGHSWSIVVVHETVN